ncbi:hypothetical protein DNH61_11695 [Paenibacillus sambharensis]|uniref:Uncharacterized protein n=1 Tax=Paenibacillus sambharensis TaxID=1803190 RepID=A0A2W1L7G6_9BACL|nr:hypothetical protein [Paenibacillus sambharensis]PZD95216.1 hypothetical protein DNH61_11695 [Paenibacillus sambharensis]
MKKKERRTFAMQEMSPVGPARPLMERTELERAEASLRTYHLSPEELAAYIEKTGAPIRPLNQGRRQPSLMHRHRPRAGKEA